MRHDRRHRRRKGWAVSELTTYEHRGLPGQWYAKDEVDTVVAALEAEVQKLRTDLSNAWEMHDSAHATVGELVFEAAELRAEVDKLRACNPSIGQTEGSRANNTNGDQ
jgi:uncharacterized small protein (DUF1192 family)